MSRVPLRAMMIALMISIGGAAVVTAGDPGQYMGYYAYPQPMLLGPIAHHSGAPNGMQVPPPPAHRRTQNNAALYPCPRPGIPAYTGGTIITHPALDPHEMLYGHTYKTLHAPYFYKVSVDGFHVPFIGGKTCHRVELIGTQVKVKYRSEYSLFSLFVPPI